MLQRRVYASFLTHKNFILLTLKSLSPPFDFFLIHYTFWLTLDVYMLQVKTFFFFFLLTGTPASLRFSWIVASSLSRFISGKGGYSKKLHSENHGSNVWGLTLLLVRVLQRNRTSGRGWEERWGERETETETEIMRVGSHDYGGWEAPRSAVFK